MQFGGKGGEDAGPHAERTKARHVTVSELLAVVVNQFEYFVKTVVTATYRHRILHGKRSTQLAKDESDLERNKEV